VAGQGGGAVPLRHLTPRLLRQAADPRDKPEDDGEKGVRCVNKIRRKRRRRGNFPSKFNRRMFFPGRFYSPPQKPALPCERPKEGPSMEGVLHDRGTFRGIARTLLALALLAERTAGRSFPIRFLVLAILYRAEAIARRFVAREAARLIAEAIEAGYPDLPFPDLACLDEPAGLHYGAADAGLLSLRLSILAAVLVMFSDAEDLCDDHSAGFADDWFGGWPAVPALGAGTASDLPLLVIIRRPAARRPSRPP